MSIRELARELYRLRQEEELLSKELDSKPAPEREAFEERLRQVHAERRRLQDRLEGAKEAPCYRVAR